MASVIRYTDWEVTEAHASVIRSNIDAGIARHMQVRKSIPGLTGERVIKGLRSGIWIKPLGMLPGLTFSCVQDVARRSLVVLVRGTTSEKATGTPDYDRVRTKMLGLFHNRRATGLNGEKYSTIQVGNYDVDETLRREMDLDFYEITTWIREDREDDWLS